MLEKIRDLISEQLDIDKNDITLSSDLINDLDADSLDIVQLLIIMENEFDIEFSDDEIKSLKTVGDVAGFIEDKREK